MELLLQRDLLDAHRTFGKLHIDGEYECETLEDTVREVKVPGETAIPAGRYRITLENSHRFGPNTLTINNVPGFTSIRIHGGNTEDDTKGCVLVGINRTLSGINTCKPALDDLKIKVARMLHQPFAGEVWITIKE